ncbi:AI-2E family transporter, partial [Candidatus Microgenomates bacterium]|nr:AI-2E family transporter [Candidatus Microgenomates bacterium]
KFLLSIIPNQYKEDYLFLEKTLSQTFATFIELQVFMGLILGGVTFVTLLVLGINFPLSTAIFASILAMIPVIGAIIFIIPVILAGITVSLQTTIIAVIIITVAAQLVYNIIGPKLMGTALKIHPIVILLSFIAGYRLGGLWGAVFAIPVTSATFVFLKEVLKYWQAEPDN